MFVRYAADGHPQCHSGPRACGRRSSAQTRPTNAGVGPDWEHGSRPCRFVRAPASPFRPASNPTLGISRATSVSSGFGSHGVLQLAFLGNLDGLVGRGDRQHRERGRDGIGEAGLDDVRLQPKGGLEGDG